MHKYLAMLGSFVFVALSTFFVGQQYEAQKWKTKLEQDRALFLQQAREQEQLIAAHYQQIDQSLIKQWEKKEHEKNRLIDELRSGNVQLRDRLRAKVPQPTGATCEYHAEEASGLSDEDAAFLIRFAQDADRNTEQLAACQALLTTSTP